MVCLEKLDRSDFEEVYRIMEQVLTRMQIIDYVWKDSEEIPYDRVIDVYIKELRKKLQLDCITTIRNVGYKLERK